MDYNKSIPDIYSPIQSEKSKDMIILELNLEPYQIKIITKFNDIYSNFIKIPSNIIFLFELDAKNVFLDDIKMWNNMIIINKFPGLIQNLLLYNNNDHNVHLKIYVKQNINIIYYSNLICTEKQLYTSYCGVKTLFHIICQTSEPIKDNLIKIKKFNIEIFYKVKHLCNEQSYYLLTLQHIKNTFTDDIIDFILYDYYDIDKIIDTYNNFGDKLNKFDDSNKKYIKENNIVLPEDIIDEDGLDNIFYCFSIKSFKKKYNIIKYDIIRLLYN
jgi:hypothetical protein